MEDDTFLHSEIFKLFAQQELQQDSLLKNAQEEKFYKFSNQLDKLEELINQSEVRSQVILLKQAFLRQDSICQQHSPKFINLVTSLQLQGDDDFLQ